MWSLGNTNMAPLVLLLAALSATVTRSEARCGREMPEEPKCGKSDLVTIAVEDPNLGEVERSFTLHVPAGYSKDNSAAVPLVLDFHAFLGEQYTVIWKFERHKM